MRVKDLMTQPAQACTTADRLDRAAALMWDHDCGAVPVIDAADQRLVGVVTDRDICMAALFHAAPIQDIRVTDVMTTDVCSCVPESELSDAEQLMSDRQVHRLPVIDDTGRLIGMLSVSDVVRRTKRNGKSAKSASIEDQALSTLAAIRRPRPHRMAVERAAS